MAHKDEQDQEIMVKLFGDKFPVFRELVSGKQSVTYHHH